MKVVNYTTNYGHRGALVVSVGRKWTQLILIEHPVKLKRVLNTEDKYFKDIGYSVAKCKRIIKDMAKAYYGVYRNAPKSLRRVL